MRTCVIYLHGSQKVIWALVRTVSSVLSVLYYLLHFRVFSSSLYFCLYFFYFILSVIISKYSFCSTIASKCLMSYYSMQDLVRTSSMIVLPSSK